MYWNQEFNRFKPSQKGGLESDKKIIHHCPCNSGYCPGCYTYDQDPNASRPDSTQPAANINRTQRCQSLGGQRHSKLQNKSCAKLFQQPESGNCQRTKVHCHLRSQLSGHFPLLLPVAGTSYNKDHPNLCGRSFFNIQTSDSKYLITNYQLPIF